MYLHLQCCCEDHSVLVYVGISAFGSLHGVQVPKVQRNALIC